jgi:hypothetical protein
MTLDDPVDHILAVYRIPGPWQPLKATGLANRIYATSDVVLRIATDHSDAIPDARLESVAAPIARSAGILTPQRLRADQALTDSSSAWYSASRTQPDSTERLCPELHRDALPEQAY